MSANSVRYTMKPFGAASPFVEDVDTNALKGVCNAGFSGPTSGAEGFLMFVSITESDIKWIVLATFVAFCVGWYMLRLALLRRGWSQSDLRILPILGEAFWYILGAMAFVALMAAVILDRSRVSSEITNIEEWLSGVKAPLLIAGKFQGQVTKRVIPGGHEPTYLVLLVGQPADYATQLNHGATEGIFGRVTIRDGGTTWRLSEAEHIVLMRPMDGYVTGVGIQWSRFQGPAGKVASGTGTTTAKCQALDVAVIRRDSRKIEAARYFARPDIWFQNAHTVSNFCFHEVYGWLADLGFWLKGEGLTQSSKRAQE